MKKKIVDMVKTTFTDINAGELKHRAAADRDGALKMAAAKQKWVVEYQGEREKKREYVRQHVLAAGLEVADLWSKLQEASETARDAVVAGLDDVTMTELTNVVDEMAHEEQQKREAEEADAAAGQIDSSAEKAVDNSDAQSALALFDKLQAKEDQELDDSVSSVRSSNSFRSMGTRKAKLTVLNQKAYSQIYVAE